MNIMMLLIGLLLLATGVFYVIKMVLKNRECKIPSEAVITRVEITRRRSNGKRRKYYVPIVEFQAGGQTYEADTGIESIWVTKFREGQTMQIRYNEKDPTKIIVKGKTFFSDFLIAITGLVLGVIIIILAF